MIVAVTLVLLFWLLWFSGPYIRRWLMRRGMRYMQDRMYRNMGIDPEAIRSQQQQSQGQDYARHSGRRRRRTARRGKIIPADYGVTVDFLQLNTDGTERWLQDTALSPVYKEYRNETQITDAQYTLIP